MKINIKTTTMTNQENVSHWATNVAGFMKTATAQGQYSKMREEFEELRHANTQFYRYGLGSDRVKLRAEVFDGIGDLMVTAYVRASVEGITLPTDIQSEPCRIDATVKLVWELNPEHPHHNPDNVAADLYTLLCMCEYIAAMYDRTAQKCFNEVMNILYKRTGKVVDGVFIKDEDTITREMTDAPQQIH